ncbi:MAG: hypothetical protein IJD31_02050 [Lachnospiraceae bacterium]|nr:hypothetical protein [Lachnospiraceae bacterium]
MLNEVLEFKAYVTNPESDNPRIKPKMLTNSFSDTYELNGLERILTTVAREFLFSYFADKKNELISEPGEHMIETVTYILRKWCGFNNPKVENRDDFKEKTIIPTVQSNAAVQKWFDDYPEADGWLRKYWIYHFKKKNKSKDIKPEQLWNRVEEERSGSLESPNDFRAKKITYKNVIANALEMGPLNNRYLVFKKDKKTETVEEKKRFDYLFEVAEDANKPNFNTKQKFLKSIAAYLIFREYHPKGQQEILIRHGQLMNWYGDDDAGYDMDECHTRFRWKGKAIISRGTTIYGSKKLIVAPEYLEVFDYQLINESQIEEYWEKYWILEDGGHGEAFLIVNSYIK